MLYLGCGSVSGYVFGTEAQTNLCLFVSTLFASLASCASFAKLYLLHLIHCICYVSCLGPTSPVCCQGQAMLTFDHARVFNVRGPWFKIQPCFFFPVSNVGGVALQTQTCAVFHGHVMFIENFFGMCLFQSSHCMPTSRRVRMQEEFHNILLALLSAAVVDKAGHVPSPTAFTLQTWLTWLAGQAAVSVVLRLCLPLFGQRQRRSQGHNAIGVMTILSLFILR